LNLYMYAQKAQKHLAFFFRPHFDVMNLKAHHISNVFITNNVNYLFKIIISFSIKQCRYISYL
jgi:hypothetical protein